MTKSTTNKVEMVRSAFYELPIEIQETLLGDFSESLEAPRELFHSEEEILRRVEAVGDGTAVFRPVEDFYAELEAEYPELGN